jgi:hypothetical protein
MWDSAYKGLDAISIREFGERPIFLDWNAGREALIAYLVAATQMLLGTSVVAVQLVVALAGCVTLIFLYLFVRSTFNAKLALLTTFLVAISKWHIIHSRYGLRLSFLPMFEFAVLYFIVRAFRSGKLKWMVIAGLLGGLGFYGYIAFRIFPFILFVFLINSPWRKELIKQWKGITVAVLLAAFVVAPFAWFSIQNFDRFSDRMKRTAVWSAAGVKEPAHQMIFKSTAATLGLFTYKGDRILKHNVNEEPMLSPWISAFLLLGFAIAIANASKPFALFWLAFLVLSLIPGFLTVQAPHSGRTLGACIPSIFLAAIGIVALLHMLRDMPSVLRTAILALIFAGAAYSGINDALLRYTEILENASSRDSSNWGQDRDQYDIAILLNQLGPRCEAFLSPQLYFHSTIEYLTYRKSSHELYSSLHGLEKPKYKRKVKMVFLIKDKLDAWWLRDEEGKHFFKWWEQQTEMNRKQIRALVFRTYRRTTRTDDMRLLESLIQQYPNGKIVDLGRFVVFTFH